MLTADDEAAGRVGMREPAILVREARVRLPGLLSAIPKLNAAAPGAMPEPPAKDGFVTFSIADRVDWHTCVTGRNGDVRS